MTVDFLKTLMLYMTLLATLSVQEGPLPQDVPMPTAAPSVEAAVTFSPFQTEVPTATPAPTPAPVPQITPNSRYETLRFNDRSNDVRKLQKRLIELGYMPSGSADGAYGYQTYNAVRDFQRANGLDADGVAGPKTLTYLYENPGVRPLTTPTAVPTATPTPTLAPIPTPVPVTPAPVTPTPAVQATIVPPVEVTADPFALTVIPDPVIISGDTGREMVITQVVDGIQVPLKLQLWQTAEGEAVLSLREIADCLDGWSMTGSVAEGAFTVQAAGYEMRLLLAGDTVRVVVDGRSVELDADDVRCRNGVVYVTGEFLQKTLDAGVLFDADERSLVLTIRDKALNQSAD